MYNDSFENESKEQYQNGATEIDHEHDNESKPIISISKSPPFKFNKSQNKLNLQITIALITCLSTCLDGYMLIFIGYNNSILNRKWNLSQTHLLLIEFVYHITSALGGIISIPTCYFSNQIGMNYNFVFSLSAIPVSLFLFNTNSYFGYLICIGYICLSNGHLYNIGTNLIINKFSVYSRGSIFALIYFLNQVGKLVFAFFIFKYSTILQSGNIAVTIVPIVLLLIFEIIVNYNMLEVYYINYKNTKMNLTEQINNTNAKKKNNMIYNLIYLNFLKFTKNSNEKFNLYKWLFQPIRNIFEQSPPLHGVFLVIINMSLGIQFFAMVNVFPLLRKPIPTFLTNEIFFSKITHTILLGAFTLICLLYTVNAKVILFIAFTINLILNLSIMFDWFDSYWMIHLFRFVWNVSYVMNNIYCAEAILKKNRGTNTSFLYTMFKLSCILEIVIVNRIIEISLFLPIAINIFLLLFNIVVVNKLQVDTYMKSCQEIDDEIRRLTDK